MPTTIQIHVFRGDQPELLPAMCMFCAKPLNEDEYQSVVMKVGDIARPVPLPICSRDRLPGGVLYPDGHGQMNVNTVAAGAAFGVLGAVIAHNVQRHQQGNRATFTFRKVHDQFASELERIRNLSPAEYDRMMAKANQAFAAKIAGSEGAAEDDRRRQEKEQQQVLDEATFGLQDAVGTGKVTDEVTRSSQTQFMMVALVVGVLSVLLLICISSAVIAYVIFTRKPDDTPVAVKPGIEKPKEQMAKVKVIDTDERTITFLMPKSAKLTLKYSDQTEFFDRQSNRLTQGIAAVNLEDYCVILQTDDRKGLQWLKLTDPPQP